jgi:hypothetical protein
MDENIGPTNIGGTLRISGGPTGVPGKAGPEEVPAAIPFTPSVIGKRLAQVYNNSVRQDDITAQRQMIDMFIETAKSSSSDYADEHQRMPAIVFCLRGLIRFGNGEICAKYRTEYTVPYLIAIITGRHAVTETNAFIEAVECSATILSFWSIHPLKSQNQINVRPSFQSTLAASNCLILQQLVGALIEQFPKWLSTESQRNPQLPLVTRAIGSILDIMFLYVSLPLRDSWLSVAPVQFKELVPRLVSSIADRLPSLIGRCVDILDIILDHVNPDCAKNIGPTLRSALSKSHTPSVATTLNKWSSDSRRHKSLFGTLFKRSSSVSAKSILINELKTAQSFQ